MKYIYLILSVNSVFGVDIMAVRSSKNKATITIKKYQIEYPNHLFKISKWEIK